MGCVKSSPVTRLEQTSHHENQIDCHDKFINNILKQPNIDQHICWYITRILDYRTQTGDTVLLYACRNRIQSIAESLIHHMNHMIMLGKYSMSEIGIYERDIFGFDAMYYAKRNCWPDVIKNIMLLGVDRMIPLF